MDSGRNFPSVAWSPYKFDVAFGSFSSGLWLFNRKGNPINHFHLSNVDALIWLSDPPAFSKIFAIESPIDRTNYELLPSQLIQIVPETQEVTSVYQFTTPVLFKGIDTQSKYMLIEEIHPENLYLNSIVVFDLSTLTITHRYQFSETTVGYVTRIGQVTKGEDKLAFTVEGDKRIWVFDFKTKSIEIHKAGSLTGWYIPEKGFLIWDEQGELKFLKP
jgi:hypothetical protein